MRHATTLLILCCLGTGALAKDVKHAEPEPEPKGCEWAGPGYVKLPGSDTCVKLSGGVRAEFSTSR